MPYVPVAQGYNGYVGAAKETTFGTFVPATDFARVNSEGIKKDRTILIPPVIGGGRFETLRLAGNEKVSGSIDFPINLDDVVGLFLKDLLGGETYTLLESGCGSHVFVPYTTHGTPGISVERTPDSTITGNVWKASGGHVNALTFNYEPGQPLKCVADMVFQNMVGAGTAQVPTYGTNARYVMCHTGAIEVPTGSASTLKSLNLKMDGRLAADRYALGSKYITEPSLGVYKISGSMDLEFSSVAQITNFLADTSQSITIDLTCDLIGASTTRLKFILGSIYLDGETPVASGNGEIWLSLPFTSVSGTAATLASVTLVNSTVAAY